MVSAAEYETGPRWFRRHSISTMATDIVKGANDIILATNEEDWITRWSVDAAICARLREALSMSSVEPCLEYRGSVAAWAYQIWL